jgi:hypothetical protein
MCTETSQGALNGTRVNLLSRGGSEWPVLEGFPNIKEKIK